MKTIIKNKLHYYLNENKSNDIEFKIEKNKFQLFSNDDLVVETGYDIVKKDKWFNEKYLIIYDLKTIEKYRGLGYSKILLQKIFEYVKNTLNLNIISLIVDIDNYKAVNLYFKEGFEIFMEYEDNYCLIKKL